MALKYSDAVKNAKLNAIETTIGTSPILQIRTGSPPTNPGDADSGTVLVTMTLPSDWMAAASGGSKALSGTWEDTSADDTGTAGHFRIYEPGSPSTCHIQGTVSGSGGGGDMELDNTSISSGQAVSITTFTLTSGN